MLFERKYTSNICIKSRLSLQNHMKLPYVITLHRRQLVLAFISPGQKSSLIHGKCGPLDELGTRKT